MWVKKMKSLEELYNGKKVLITGGTGFLGKNMKPFLENLGAIVYAVGSEYQLQDSQDAVSLMLKYKDLDYIFHLAVLQGAGTFPLEYPADQFYINNLIHCNVFQAWKVFQPQAKMIGMGSTCSYPVLPTLKEEDYMTGPLHISVETYGLTKCNMVQGIKSYKQQYDLKGTTVVLATLYGPHDSFDLDKAHVVSALIKKFCDAVENGDEQVEVWGDGYQSRELIYVEDQIVGILLGAQYEGDLINVGKGHEVTIKMLAEVIKKESGFQGEIFYNTDRFVGVRSKCLDISKARDFVGWDGGSYDLQEGVRKTIEWYRKNKKEL